MSAPRVFISYAWEPDEYRSWVKALAERLRNDGVDVRLDAWHLEDGVSVTQFMSSEIRHANRVLVMCSPEFRRKVHLAEDGDTTNGVGWEANLLATQVFANLPNARARGLAILARGVWSDAAPDFLLGQNYIDLTSPEQFEAAYRDLLDRLLGRKNQAPPIGPTPPARPVDDQRRLALAPFTPSSARAPASGDVDQSPYLRFRISDGTITCSAQGHADVDEPFQLVLEHGKQLARDVDAIVNNRCTADDILNLGSELWLALQPGRIEPVVNEVLTRARRVPGSVVEIRLSLPRDLEGLPWEAIHDLNEDACLSVVPSYSVSRLALEAGTPKRRQASPGRKLRFLAIIPGGSGLQSSVEFQNIQTTLKTVSTPLDFEVLDGHVTPARLADKLRTEWDIVHFIGHGRYDEGDGRRFKLRLNAVVDDPAQPDMADAFWMVATTFVQTFRRAQTQLVVLNCCDSSSTESPGSSMGTSFSRLGVPATIVMRYEIRDNAAAEFSRAFYRELLTGQAAGDVGLAVQEGRAALQRSFPDPQRVRSHITPVLYLAEGCRKLLPVLEDRQTAPAVVPAREDEALPLPAKLRAAMKSGRCLPILGPGILTADAIRRESPLPDAHHLGRSIALRGKFPDIEQLHGLADTSASWLTPLLFQRYCQHFESVDQTERSGLIDAIRTAYASQTAPAAVKRIASWKVPGFAYTHVDALLEGELTRCQGRNLRVLEPADLMNGAKLVPGTVSLLNLRGHLNASESMILTEFDEDYLLDGMTEVASYVADLMNQNVGTSLVFLGVSPRDPVVRTLARRLLKQETSRSRGTAYFIGHSASEADRSYWRRFDRLEWVEDIDPDTVIRALTAASRQSIEVSP